MLPFPTVPSIQFAYCDEHTQRLLLHSEEEKLASSMQSDIRRAQFLRGRSAAREALAKLGADTTSAILRGINHEPLWPETIIGSISHTARNAVAAVAYKRDLQALGVDIEEANRKLEYDITSKICHSDEATWINKDRNAVLTRTLMLFSAKESIFKALFPLCQKYIGYLDVELQWNEREGAFEVILFKDLGEHFKKGFNFKVHCIKDQKLILTYMMLR